MSRPTRLRRPPARYRKEEDSLDAEVGNQKPKNDVLNSLRSPVLRDRTNLTVQLVKLDMKKIGNKTPENLKKDPEIKRSLRGVKTRGQDPKLDEKKSVSSKKTLKTSEDERVKSEVIKRPVPSRSSKNPGVEVTEEEPKKSPEIKKPRKASRISRIPRKTLKADDLSLEKSGSLTEKRRTRSMDIESPSKTTQPSSQNIKSKKSTMAINKLPPKPLKTLQALRKKSERRSSHRLAKKSVDKSPIKSEKKFFKARRNIPLTHSKVSPMKRGLRNPRRQFKSKKLPSPDSYQLTLQESFAKAKKSLRPRKIEKNYNEDSTKATKNDEPKGPVYKTLRIEEESPKDKNKVYEFSFDINDSKERLPKKRKKRIVRKQPAKRARRVKEPAIPVVTKLENGKNEDAEVPEMSKATKQSSEITQLPKVTEQPTKPEDKTSADNFKETADEKQKINKENLDSVKVAGAPTPEPPSAIQVTADVHHPPDSPPPCPQESVDSSQSTLLISNSQISNFSKPRIISTEALDGGKRISLTSTPLNGNRQQASCPSNPFSNRPSSQYKTMVNHSLIRRSFSPIVKEMDKFDASSPWRPVTTGFSQVKNIVQSTPQGRKFYTPHGISSLATENKRIRKINKIIEANDENANLSVIDNNSPAKSPRKFGTVLSNISSSTISKSPSMFRGFDNAPGESVIEDKENSQDNKSPKKVTKVRTPVGSPLMASERLDDTAGPSGLQKSNAKILRQTNLNNFLNIPQMPESTIINTAHGIFNDSPSAPISDKLNKITRNFTVENAFGFDEDGAFEMPSTVEEKPVVPRATKILPKVSVIRQKVEPTRLPVKKMEFDAVADNKSGESNSSGEKRHAEATKADVVEAVHFLDTFDADERELSPVEVPLFVDPEPVHFKQPPRYSYSKRKRGVKFNTSDETDHSQDDNSDNDEHHAKHKNKKRKMTKTNKKERKELEDWAKNVNQTFDEIEHFDLVVE